MKSCGTCVFWGGNRFYLDRKNGKAECWWQPTEPWPASLRPIAVGALMIVAAEDGVDCAFWKPEPERKNNDITRKDGTA